MHSEAQEQLATLRLHWPQQRLVILQPLHIDGILTNLRLKRRWLYLGVPFALEGGLEVYLGALELGLELFDLLVELVALELEADLLQC